MLRCGPRRVIEIFTWKGVAFINLALVVYGLILVGFTSAMGVVQIVKLRQEVGDYNITAMDHQPDASLMFDSCLASLPARKLHQSDQNHV